MNIEIFPCSGGMAEGFRRAGITFDFAFDASLNACNSYEANLGHRPVQMDVRDLVRMARGGLLAHLVGRLRLLVADPPCTPWSRAGKRLGTDDERDMLLETVELIRLLRPRAYLIGNVPGLDDSTQWPKLQAALAPLRTTGYCIADYASLDAADFGVPQHRVRPFWFGHLEGPCVRWPLPTHGDPASPQVRDPLPGMGLKPWVSCREALGHLSLEAIGRTVRLKWKKYDVGKGAHRPSKPDAPVRTQTRNANGDGVLVEVTEHPRHPVSKSEDPSFTIRTNGGRASGAASMLAAPRPHHHTNPERPARTQTASLQDDSQILSWPWNSPSTTICADERLPPPGHHPEEGSILSVPNAVVLSELAATILQGFPESWQFISKTKTGRWSMLGQAMPPPLAEAVARSVAAWLARTAKGALRDSA